MALKPRKHQHSLRGEDEYGMSMEYQEGQQDLSSYLKSCYTERI